MNQTSQKKDNFLIRYLVPDTNLWIEKMNDIKKVSLYFFCFLTHIIHLYHKSLWTITIYGPFKVGSVFTMVISSEFRMGQYCNDDHWEDAPQFMVSILKHILICHFGLNMDFQVKMHQGVLEMSRNSLRLLEFTG